MNLGVLAVQGDFAEHIAALNKIGAESREVRLPKHLEDLEGLIIPGGESTTLSRLMSLYQLREPIEGMARQGKVIWGTCAGMIMMAHEITEGDPVPLGLMDIGVLRNAFGRQVDSFEEDLQVAVFDSVPFHGVFIRAPAIIRVGQGVTVLSTLPDATLPDANWPDGRPVAVQQGNLLATAFHPELTNDSRFHQHFLNLVSAGRPSLTQ